MSVQNTLTKSSGNRPATFSNFIASPAIKAKINEMIGGKNGQRFITSIISAVSTNPALAECEHSSILSSAMLGESLKLSPSPQLGHYYMVPFNDRKRGGKVAQFQLGYKGYIQLAIRSGSYKKLNVLAIKEGELINFDPLNEEIEVNLIDDERAREKAKTIGYYAMFEYTNGFKKALYWSREKMEAHALAYSKGYAAKKGYTFWEKDFDGMAYKTMLRQIISKWGMLSIELQNAVTKDMAVINEDGSPHYIENDDFTDITPEVKEVEAKAEKTKTEASNDTSVEDAFFEGTEKSAA
jgi:recombination protein RecT